MSLTHLSDDAVAGIRDALLTFFERTGRDLPWRSTRDPYAIWISEVMSQQTRVETVAPYYERWIRRFPDVRTLAEAPLDDVLKQWEGLGYYARARNVHKAARLVRERHGGSLPATYAGLRDLPGIGDYTAGAVASIAFSVPRPAVDGNVRRVLARLLDVARPGMAQLRETAERLVPPDRPGDFNQAVMELGATICTPRSPRCGDCPVQAFCAARAAGTQLDRPQRIAKRAVPLIEMATAVVRRDDGQLLLVRRPDTGLLAGLWSFPARELEPGMDAADAAADIGRRFATSSTATPATPRPLCTVEHAFSHRRERYTCFIVDVAAPGRAFAGAAPAASGTAWVGEDLSGHALPRAQQRIHRQAFESGPTRATCSDTAARRS